MGFYKELCGKHRVDSKLTFDVDGIIARRSNGTYSRPAPVSDIVNLKSMV